jgi:hypothetical protein
MALLGSPGLRQVDTLHRSKSKAIAMPLAAGLQITNWSAPMCCPGLVCFVALMQTRAESIAAVYENLYAV